MKRFFKLLVVAICTMAVTIVSAVAFAACSTSETVKIGVLVADASGDEALAFKAYYENYIAEQYDVEFIYSAALEDEAEAKSQAETFIGQNCKAIIDMADKGRTTIAQLCEDNKVYYAIASGMLSDSDYETVKSNTYFVGQIGPSMTTEYEAGLAMGTYYKNKGVTKVGIYGAFIPNGMHLYRFAGLLTGLGLTYNGKSGEDIVTEVGNSVDSSLIAGNIEVLYMVSWSDTTYTELNTIISSGIDAYLSVGMASSFFASVLSSAGITFSDIDSFPTTKGDC
ncbi:MAG: sugar ABC transporter substrate-binding protein, partial [Clostridia bacterium]|nr:sugar ABC transporter substrate-binding protein [Clostridia bacterium]